MQELLALSEPWPSAQLGSIASLAPQIRTWPAPRTRQFLGSFSRQTGCFQEAISCRGRFFPKELKWGASWCRLFTGNHCESSFATHQEGLSLSRLHPALCPQPSFPGHAQGVTSVPLTHLPQAAAGMLTWGRGSSQMVKIWTGCRQCRASQGRSCMASPVPRVSLWWEKVWEKVREAERTQKTSPNFGSPASAFSIFTMLLSLISSRATNHQDRLLPTQSWVVTAPQPGSGRHLGFCVLL